MTSQAPISVDHDALRADLQAVLIKHGLGDLDLVETRVHAIKQGGMVAGVTATVTAYSNPASPAS